MPLQKLYILSLNFGNKFVLLPKLSYLYAILLIYMNTADIIMSFANSHKDFTFCELADYVRARKNITDSGILWHLKKLIKQNRLSRISRGLYSNNSINKFVFTLTDDMKQLYQDVAKAFPLIDIVIYSGNDISALQHHISANNIIYIEVTKEASESVFHYLNDRKMKTYHKPSADFMTNYVDLGEKSVIVKPLTTEAPVKSVDKVCIPTLEKILVDINADSDFYYLQDNETFYIMENARSLYSINMSKMLRYASRRGIRKKMQTILQNIS